MLFKNTVFQDGLNVTVRRGTKWAVCDSVLPVYDSTSGAERPVNIIDVKYTKVKRFCDVTEDDIVCEHDPGCQTSRGLLQEMSRLYTDFDQFELVTLVYFTVRGKDS